MVQSQPTKDTGIDKISQDYAKICQEYISRVEHNILDYTEASRHIDEASQGISLHPMLTRIAALAFDIHMDLRLSQEDKEHDWQLLTELVHNYLVGQWQATAWILMGSYIHAAHGHGLSFRVELRDGKPYIEVADDAIHAILENIVLRLNAKQTPERFLQNVALLLLKNVGQYTLGDVTIKECLMQEPHNELSVQT